MSNNINKWLTVGLIFTVTNAFCQNQVLRYSDLLREIYESKNDSVIHDNVVFEDDIGIKNKKSFLQYLEHLNSIKESKGHFLVDKKIRLSNCTFKNDLYLFNTTFNKTVAFDDNKFPNRSPNPDRLDNSAYLILDSCLFNEKLFVVSFNKSFPIFKVELISCKVNHAFWYLEMSDVDISRSEFTERFKVSLSNKSSIRIDSSFFSLNSEEDSKINNELGETTELTRCTIKGEDDLVFEILSTSRETIIEKNSFYSSVQFELAQSALTLSKNTLHKKLGLDLAKIEESVFIDMKSLKDLDFGLFIDNSNDHGMGKPLWQYYYGSSHEEVSDEKNFKHYFRVYKILYDYFRLIGDIQSSNNAYVKIRKLEGRAIKYEYDNNPSFKNYFSLTLNRLLEIYTAYGTDPARAILISFYIVILFGVFYFFFPSDWDVTSKSLLIEKFKEFIEKNEKGYVKPFFKLLLGFIVSFINAATLSLNAFTTLGFGNIPTHGIARYICVVQGFIGWFLLSIFTVALINQAQF